MSTSPTLQTIADLAGVSRNTVSAILRNRPGFAKATRERVEKIAEEQGYRTNPLVSALLRSVRKPQTDVHRGNVAFLHSYGDMGKMKNLLFLNELFNGAKARGATLGIHIDPIWINEPGMTGKKLSRILLARGVEGVIISPLDKGWGRLHLDWDKFAAVTLGFSLWRPALHRVATHQYHVISHIFRNLRHLGYSRIGFVLSRENDVRFDSAWEAGVTIAFNASPKNTGIPPLFTESITTKAFAAWLEKYKPDAVVGAGVELQSHLKALKIRIPQDIGFVEVPSGREKTSIATIRANWLVLGASALDLVIDQLIHNQRGIPDDPRTVLIEGEWSPGTSVRRQ